VRRAESILEVVGLKGDRPLTRTIFEWKPLDDSYITSEKSLLLSSISTRQGASEDTIRNEMMRRKKVLEWMYEQSIFDYRDVARVISTYYSNPDKVMDAVMSA
jgi:flagellar protein FlaI